MNGNGYLRVEDVCAMYGISKRTVHERTRRREIPFRRLPHSRRCLFTAAELEQWENGCELETEELAHGAIVVRPKGSTT